MPRIDLHSTRPGYDHQQRSSINFKASTCQKLIWFCVKNMLTQWSETLGWTDLDLIFFAGKFFCVVVCFFFFLFLFSSSVILITLRLSISLTCSNVALCCGEIKTVLHLKTCW